ncbi:ATP-binding protein [Chthonobacter rhizosphaerae]|uniref:ATP-binding protein n=1 Tax=Chthonobacter rhizosphaerae TaxID=2735553 RepID=UPI003CCE3B9D
MVGRVLEAGDDGARLVREGLSRITPWPLVALWNGLARAINRIMPKGLLGRSLLIIVVPMVILQTVVAYVFMDRHWELVTGRLSAAVVRDIAAMVDLIDRAPPGADISELLEIAGRRMNLDMELLAPEPLPPPRRRALFTLLDRTLSRQIEAQLGVPYWIDTVGQSEFVEVRLVIPKGVLRVVLDRGNAYASNSHIFIVWMVSTALVLILVSIIFIRNQIKPIQRLANAATAFGKGRPVGAFSPQGAREVRRAAHAFIEMRRRIERQMEQRTTMLAGVSHDLRTILTRFRLELALLPEDEETLALRRDVDEMEAMLEAYMAFAKSDTDEEAHEIDVEAVIAEVAERAGAAAPIPVRFSGSPLVTVKPGGFRRLVGNLVGNAVRYGRRVSLEAEHRDGWLTIRVDDDGPGIPEAERENVFKPFYRLDSARNQDTAGTGLGLAIARDIARGHGGMVRLETSPLGGLRALVRLPG